MSVLNLLAALSITIKREGDDFVIDCPSCGKDKHCHVDTTNGLWHCWVCEAKGNPFQIVKHFIPGATPKDIMTLLDQHGLADTSNQPKASKSNKDLSWLRDKLRKPACDDIDRICRSKGIDERALLTFSPYVSKVDPVMFLPGMKPGQPKACGFLRVHLDGELIDTKSGKQKYPMLGSWGLLGLRAAEQSDTIIFAEGWRDALACIEAGFVAIANTGGTGWQDDWLSLFQGKKVYIVPDADEPGVKSAKERAAKIYNIARQVSIVELPYEVTKTSGKDLFDYLKGLE